MKKLLSIMERNFISALAVAACLVVGCKTDVEEESLTEAIVEEESLTEAIQSSSTYALVVGMENSDAFGSCPGAALDARRMKELLSRYTKNVTYLTDKSATYGAVKSAMENGVKNGDLFIFYYSGHGGSEKFTDTGAEEVDGRDEFLCLNDTYFRDNLVWEIISKSKGRVMIIADCCHSQTIFRSPVFTLTNPIEKDMMKLKSSARGETFSMLCWSGCPDDTYSYGSESGGKFTNTLLKYFDSKSTYDELWAKIKADKNLLVYEEVQITKIGTKFDGKKVFQ